MLSDLEEMGFNNRERNKELLVENSGSIKKTVMQSGRGCGHGGRCSGSGRHGREGDGGGRQWMGRTGCMAGRRRDSGAVVGR